MSDMDNNTPATAATVEDDDKWKGIKLGSCCFKIPMFVHWSFSFLLIASLFLAVLDWNYRLALFFLLLNGCILLLSVVVHELAHAWVSIKLGGTVDSIVIWPLGGLTLSSVNSARNDFFVAIAGPLSHIPMIAIWAVLFVIVRPEGDTFAHRPIDPKSIVTTEGFFTELFLAAFYLNVIISVANIIIPTYPLDGSRCLASFLIMCGCSTVKSAIITSIWSMIVSIGLVIYALYLLFTNEFSGIFILVIGALNFSNGNNLYKMAKGGRVRDDPLFSRSCYNEGPPASETEAPSVQMKEAEII